MSPAKHSTYEETAMTIVSITVRVCLPLTDSEIVRANRSLETQAILADAQHASAVLNEQAGDVVGRGEMVQDWDEVLP